MKGSKCDRYVYCEQHYGSIVFFEWFSDGNIMIAFSEGYFIGISTKIDVRHGVLG